MTQTGRGLGAAPRSVHSLAGAAEGAFDLAVGIALGHRLSLVALRAALGDAELDLRPTLFEVQRERDERDALLVDLRLQAIDLAAVQQQLAGTIGIVRPDADGELVGAMWTPSIHTSPLRIRA